VIAIYVGVSTEEQAIKGSSIDSQIEACIKKAGTKDVLKYADEGFSGELLKRPAFNRLRMDSKLPQIELVHKEEERQTLPLLCGWNAEMSSCKKFIF